MDLLRIPYSCSMRLHLWGFNNSASPPKPTTFRVVVKLPSLYVGPFYDQLKVHELLIPVRLTNSDMDCDATKTSYKTGIKEPIYLKHCCRIEPSTISHVSLWSHLNEFRHQI